MLLYFRNRSTGNVSNLIITLYYLIEIRYISPHGNQAEISHSSQHLSFANKGFQLCFGFFRLYLGKHFFYILNSIVGTIDCRISILIVIVKTATVGGRRIVIRAVTISDTPVSGCLRSPDITSEPQVFRISIEHIITIEHSPRLAINTIDSIFRITFCFPIQGRGQFSPRSLVQ